MKVFVVNCGSSSIKYQLFDMADESVVAKGLLERVGSDQAMLHHTAGEVSVDRAVSAPDHKAAFALAIDALTDGEIGVLGSVDEIDAVGHRVVHGGDRISASCRIDQSVIDIIRENFPLSPLHNPANLMGIEAAMAAMGDKCHVAVFDTAFLATLPPRAYRYGVPESWYRQHHVRRYGFHGTSHRYVTLRAAELLGKDPQQVNLITAHLGNGCSMTAVRAGEAVDHSMGMTPLAGLMMGTRCGDIDPAVVFYMAGRGLTIAQIDEALNTQSGLLGISGRSNDMRDVLAAAETGEERAKLAVEMFVYQIVKYIGAYCAVVGDPDAIVLTGGIGENSLPIRREICNSLGHFGVSLDSARNEATKGGLAGPITTDESRLPVWIVGTNEELMIARDTVEIVRQGN